jgi:hypothetical protein
VDFDGDGKRDLWNSVPDVIGSVANYFKKHGWKKDAGVVFPVKVKDTSIVREKNSLKPYAPVADFMRDGVSLINSRTRFHFYATGITPAMVKPPVGGGSQYVIGLRDAESNPLDGSKTYRIHIPPNVPARRFWEITVYDNQTRSFLQTDQPHPGVPSIDANAIQNADGSYDVYIGPKEPEGNVNWIQSIPGKGWNLLWRIYGPEQAWYDKKWRPGEIELVK